jgi:hypothetical protein
LDRSLFIIGSVQILKLSNQFQKLNFPLRHQIGVTMQVATIRVVGADAESS